MFRALCTAFVVLPLISFTLIGQTSQPTANQVSKTGAITGRVVNESGQPLPNAHISVQPVGEFRAGGRTSTNRDGAFKVTGLEPVPYRVSVIMPAYIRASDEPESGPSAKQYKVGDSVTFVLTKGGVITGTVTDASGDPVIGIEVGAQMIRNQRDQRVTSTARHPPSTTDDRGVYRIYGLPTGTYIVIAGDDPNYSEGPFGAFDTFVPTYAPSSTRDGAAEISVRAGEETSNVDISFRAEMGRTISGIVGEVPIEAGFNVTLTTAAPAGTQSNVSHSNEHGSSQFIFPGLADGDYYLTARAYPPGSDRLLSEPMLIRVRGADVDDVELTLRPLASVSGRVLLEESKAIDCQGKQPPVFKEISISAWHKDDETTRNQPQFIWSMGAPVNPDAQGNFTIRNLAPSQYYFAARFPARSWYLKSIAISAPVPTNTGAARARKPTDVTRIWTTVKTGDRLSGLFITLAPGAALLEGQVVLSEGEARPEKLVVYLVPNEREAADELLRYYGATVSDEGKIGLYNLAPGRYWILAQPESMAVPLTKLRLPDETETRARLRRDAEAAKTEIELKPCQSVTDFKLRPANRIAR